jgi:hypothetical protein
MNTYLAHSPKGSIYRKALVLPGEAPEEIVAELHHRADFEVDDIRYGSGGNTKKIRSATVSRIP